MKIYWSRTVFCIMTVTTLCWDRSAAQVDNVYAFTRANVVPMSNEMVLTDYTVVVREGRIQEVGPSSSTKIPRGATTIDARGQFLIPALSDMHVHLEGDAWNIMFSGESRFSGDEIDFDEILFLFTAHGITTIEVMAALPEHILLREKIRRNELLGPRLILSRMIDQAGRAWPPPICTWVNNAEEAGKAVVDIHAQGYERIKVYSFLERECYDSIVAVAGRLGMPVDGHIPYSTSVEYVVSSGQNMIAHTEEVKKFAKDFSAEQVDHYASLLAKSNTWVTTALSVNRNLNALLADSASEFTKPGTEYLHPMGRGIWAYIYQHLYKPIPEADRRALVDGYDSFQKPFTYRFAKMGGKLLTGTDVLMPSTLPGSSLHEELAEMVSAGLTPFEALKVSTTNVYDFLGERDRAGTIEPGKNADLVLLDGNPLEDISNTRRIAGVMTQGRWITKGQIEGRLKEIRESYARLLKKKSD